jgi:glycosyltransferase involved in cell wall biosynthesis
VATDPATSAPLVSVVIPVLNGAATLPEQLQALAGQTYPGRWEVVVADNGSTDATVQVVGEWAAKLPCLRLIDASDRMSTNHARNLGAAAADGDLLVFCDADDVATPGWLAAMVNALGSYDLVGGRLDDEALNDPVSRSWRSRPDTGGLPSALYFRPYATSANLGVRAEVLRVLGGWNQDFVRGGTEVEFCWRAQLAGYRLGFEPDAVIQYRYRSTRWAFAYQLYRYGRAEAQLFRAFRDQGVSRPSLYRACRAWAWTVIHLPDLLRSRTDQGRWLRTAAFRVGRLDGSIRFRTLCL